MKRFWMACLVVIAVLGLAGGAAAAEKKFNPQAAKKGAALVKLAGCGDCHTPMKMDEAMKMPVPDMARMYSGHPEGAPDPASTLAPGDMMVASGTMTSFKMPFGTVYTANLTPDKETGLGGWTEAQFIQTLKTGKHLGTGRAIMPPMPWTNLVGASDSELKSMYHFFMSLPAVHNRVPELKVAPEAIEAQGKANAMMLQHMMGAAAKPAHEVMPAKDVEHGKDAMGHEKGMMKEHHEKKEK